jgi:hypothetical protein
MFFAQVLHYIADLMYLTALDLSARASQLANRCVQSPASIYRRGTSKSTPRRCRSSNSCCTTVRFSVAP